MCKKSETFIYFTEITAGTWLINMVIPVFIALVQLCLLSPCWSVLDFWKINLELSSSMFKSISNLIFIACFDCKNPVLQNWFLQLVFFKNKVQINRGYEQPLKFLFFWLPCVCLGDLGASVRFSTVSSTKRSSNLSVHKVSILSWSLFFWKRLYKKIRFILINKCEGRTKPLRVPSALWLPNSFP